MIYILEFDDGSVWHHMHLAAAADTILQNKTLKKRVVRRTIIEAYKAGLPYVR